MDLKPIDDGSLFALIMAVSFLLAIFCTGVYVFKRFEEWLKK